MAVLAALNSTIFIIWNNKLSVYPGPHIVWFPRRIVGSGPNAEVRQVRSEKLDHINELVSKQRLPKTLLTNRRRQVVRSRVVGTSPTPPRQCYMQPHLAFPAPPPSYNVNQRNHPLMVQTPRQPYVNRQRYQNNRSYQKRPQQQKSPLQSEPSPRSPVFEAASPSPSFEEHVEPPELSPQVNKKYMENKLLSVEDEDSMFYDEVEERVPEEMKNNLRNLIGDHPEGIWCCDLPKLYMSRYLTELDYTAYKFRTLNEMCLYLASIFHYIRPNKGDFKLYDKRAPVPDDLSVQLCLDVDEEKHSAIATPDDSEILNLEALGFSDEPSNVVQYLEDIPRQWLSQDQNQGSLIDVWIAEVYDPSKFWFIINKQKLDEMMNEMQIYYAANKHKYEVPPHKLKEGLYCCAVLFSEYHRAIVVAKSLTPTDDKIKLYFIDYGTVAKVPINGICYLHRKYAVLPQQAMRGRLAGIYPPGAQQQWSRDVCTKFFDLIAEKPLVARIEKINLQKQFVHVTLIETPAKGSQDPPIFINEVLINEGYAVSSPEAQKEIEMSKYAVPIVRHLHFYPTYEELEQGLVPSAPEMINLLHNGCSLELIYPQYFQRTYYKHELQKLRTEVFNSQSVSSDESVDALSSCSSNVTTDELKSSGMEELVNFTEDMIPDKGGTDTKGRVSSQNQVNLEPPPSPTEPTEMKEKQQPHSAKRMADVVASSETQQSNQKDTNQEVVEEFRPAAITVKPPPGFERVLPNLALQQNVMMPPQNYSHFSPIVQQNYFLPPYGTYQTPIGYALQMSPYNYYPMYQYQQLVPPLQFQSASTPLEPISEYLNFLKNEKPVIVETEKTESSDSEVIACGTLANKDNDTTNKQDAEIKVVKTVNEVEKVEKNESETKSVKEEDIKKNSSENEQMQATSESEENTKKKRRKLKKLRTSESEQCETDAKIRQDCEEAKGSSNKEVIIQKKTKHQKEQKTAEHDTNKQSPSEKSKTVKSGSVNGKIAKEKESVDISENTENQPPQSKIKVSQILVTKGKTEKSGSINNKNNKRKDSANISENSENKSPQSKTEVETKSKTGKNGSINSKSNKRKDKLNVSKSSGNNSPQSKTNVSQVTQRVDSWEQLMEPESKIVKNENHIQNRKDIPEKELSQNKTDASQTIETVDSWEQLLEEDICLLDTSEQELVALLSHPDSRNYNELDAVEKKLLVDNTAPLQPRKINECDLKTESDEEILDETMQIEPQKYVEKKVIAGKTLSIITWEQKRYVVLNEALKTFAGLELPVVNTKIRLARRKIFMKDIDVNTIETDVQEEFSRNNLVTASKFGKFVHLIQLEQLPNLVETFIPGMELNIADIL